MAGQSFNTQSTISAMDVVSITLSDTTDQATQYAFRGFMVSVAGDVSIVTLAGNIATVPGCLVGVIYAIGATRFRSTGTTATGIKGLV